MTRGGAAGVYTRLWQPKVDSEGLPVLISTLVFETASFTKTGPQRLSVLACQQSNIVLPQFPRAEIVGRYYLPGKLFAWLLGIQTWVLMNAWLLLSPLGYLLWYINYRRI